MCNHWLSWGAGAEVRRVSVVWRILLILFVVAGCATLRTDEEWATVENMAREQTGEDVIWEQSEAERERIQHEVEILLGDGLTRQDAVRIALINNRRLQSTLEEIGISKSDLVQAGLFRNPSLEALFRFPSGGGRTNIFKLGSFISGIEPSPFANRFLNTQSAG